VIDLLVNGVRAPRIAPARVLRIFARHGVPTRTPPPHPEPERPTFCKRVTWRRSSGASSNFEYGLTRSADDLAPTRYYGKGAAFCYRKRSDVIFVWSMGRN
jgi:hypothetical protein